MTVGFKVVVLGATGGLLEGNLNAFLIAPRGHQHFVALDAGSFSAGLEKAWSAGSFGDIEVPGDTDLRPERWILNHCVKAYLISHAHLDHVAGLVLNSTDDAGPKPLLGLAEPLNYLREHLFNWRIWPNFADSGTPPCLGKYHYQLLSQGRSHPIEHTAMTVTPYRLSHSGDYRSTAFLIEAQGHHVLFFGDTGADAVENSHCIATIWDQVAPLVRDGYLRGVLLEVSYPNSKPVDQLYGHLTPAWMLHELHQLARRVTHCGASHPRPLEGLTVIITAIKPSFRKCTRADEQIRQELLAGNDLGVNFVFPHQGECIVL